MVSTFVQALAPGKDLIYFLSMVDSIEITLGEKERTGLLDETFVIGEEAFATITLSLRLGSSIDHFNWIRSERLSDNNLFCLCYDFDDCVEVAVLALRSQ